MGILPLLFCLAAMGGSRQVDLPKTVLHVDFGTADLSQVMDSSGVPVSVTRDPDKEAGGTPSLLCDVLNGSNQWNEFFHSKQGVFKPKIAYRVSFDYAILGARGGANFYYLFRRTGNNSWISDKFTNLPLSPKTGHVSVNFFPGNADDFYMIIGIQGQGAMSISNLTVRTDPDNTPPDAQLPEPKRTWQATGGTTYYVDANQGDDGNSGTSPANAWRSLDKVNAGVFAPGDKILLRSGCRWSGYLSPAGSGTADRPILAGRYGEGAAPRIDGNELSLATVYLHNLEYWRVADLEITNTGHVPVLKLAGVELNLDNFGTAHGIVLDGLYIHDVSGSNDKDAGGGNGIFVFRSEGPVKSRYDGLTIEHCHLRHDDRNGITMDGYPSRSRWYPNLHVVIRNNLLEDIGGDGIVPIGCDGVVVEHNVLHGGRMRCADYAAGIWPWSCDNTVVQFNEVSGMHGTNDGEGYDSDFNCRNSLFQYNYSHDNEGGFMLICDDGDMKSDFNVGNVGSVIRYNISVGDGLHTFNITGPCRNTAIYNNVFYLRPGQKIDLAASGNWGGDYPADTRFSNNVFFVGAGGQGTFDFGGMRGVAFDHNAFWGAIAGRPSDGHAVLADPLLASPGSLKPAGYRLKRGSPCIGAGRSIANAGARDFWGLALVAGRKLNIGADQSKGNR